MPPTCQGGRRRDGDTSNLAHNARRSGWFLPRTFFLDIAALARTGRKNLRKSMGSRPRRTGQPRHDMSKCVRTKARTTVAPQHECKSFALGPGSPCRGPSRFSGRIRRTSRIARFASSMRPAGAWRAAMMATTSSTLGASRLCPRRGARARAARGAVRFLRIPVGPSFTACRRARKTAMCLRRRRSRGVGGQEHIVSRAAEGSAAGAENAQIERCHERFRRHQLRRGEVRHHVEGRQKIHPDDRTADGP